MSQKSVTDCDLGSSLNENDSAQSLGIYDDEFWSFDPVYRGADDSDPASELLAIAMIFGEPWVEWDEEFLPCAD